MDDLRGRQAGNNLELLRPRARVAFFFWSTRPRLGRTPHRNLTTFDAS
jgi:hypothetical protein